MHQTINQDTLTAIFSTSNIKHTNSLKSIIHYESLIAHRLEFKQVNNLQNFVSKLNLTQTPYKQITNNLIVTYKEPNDADEDLLNLYYMFNITVISDIDIYLDNVSENKIDFGSFTILNIDLSNTKIKTLNSLFEATGINTITLGNIEVTDMYSIDKLFYGSRDLESIDFGQLDFSRTVSANRAFEECFNLETIDLSNKIAYNLKYVHSMFNGCLRLKSLILPNIHIPHTAQNIFYRFGYIEFIDLSSMNSEDIDLDKTGIGLTTNKCLIKFKDREVILNQQDTEDREHGKHS